MPCAMANTFSAVHRAGHLSCVTASELTMLLPFLRFFTSQLMSTFSGSKSVLNHASGSWQSDDPCVGVSTAVS